jgi:glycosyltransferase involved in cell wall biosynthesis
LNQSLYWHATDRQEEADIKKIFGDEARVIIAPNIPKAPYLFLPERKKKRNELKLVYLSLIAEKKNLHLALLAIREIKSTPIIFDIYGPIKDQEYWEHCQPLMESIIHQIHYKGAINPTSVQDTLSKYDAFILPTKGENFGHAIYEALSVGTPCIISRFTPWGLLQGKSAGITVDLTIESIKDAIDRCLLWSNLDLERESSGAYALAVNYFKKYDYMADYNAVF